MVSKEDLDWRGVRNASLLEADNRYTMHRLTNAIFVVCYFAAMICHIVCFGVLLNKLNEIKDKIGDPPNTEVCVLYVDVSNVKINGTPVAEYKGKHTCDMVIYTSIILAISAVGMMIFLSIRTYFVKK